MMMRRAAIAAALTVGAGAPLLAQQAGEMTLYSGTNYSGARYTVTGQRNMLNLGYPVRSVRIAPGDAWQLCMLRDQQRCSIFRQSIRNMSLTVQSAMPVQQVVPLPQPLPGGNGQSLRGMAAEFFPQPADRGGRVASPGNANAAADVANNFCRQLGWNRSAHQRLETVAGRVYLADVLCVRA